MPATVSSRRTPSRLAPESGCLFAACCVALMALACVGELLEPILMSELAFDIVASELGLEAIMMSLPSWSILELLLAGLAMTVGLSAIHAHPPARIPALFPTDPRLGDKVPI
jgi:hypothetical protein